MVTDGHDKKLKLKQPFFKCEEVRALPAAVELGKNSLSCSMNLVEKPAFPDIFQLARGKTTPPNTHSSPRNPVWYLRISNAVPSRLFLRYVSDLMLYHQTFKLVLKYHAKLLFMTFIYPSHRFSRAVDTGIAVAFYIHIFLPLLLLSSPEQPILYHILTHIFKGFLSTTSM